MNQWIDRFKLKSLAVRVCEVLTKEFASYFYTDGEERSVLLLNGHVRECGMATRAEVLFATTQVRSCD